MVSLVLSSLWDDTWPKIFYLCSRILTKVKHFGVFLSSPKSPSSPWWTLRFVSKILKQKSPAGAGARAGAGAQDQLTGGVFGHFGTSWRRILKAITTRAILNMVITVAVPQILSTKHHEVIYTQNQVNMKTGTKIKYFITCQGFIKSLLFSNNSLDQRTPIL